MKDISSFNKIYLAVEPVDFRKQAHGLSLLVEPIFKILPSDTKVLFVFTNRRKTAVKLLHWDATGFALWWKVLEKDKFHWPKSTLQAKTLQVRELKWLLDGVDLRKINTHKKLNFQSQGYARENRYN